MDLNRLLNKLQLQSNAYSAILIIFPLLILSLIDFWKAKLDEVSIFSILFLSNSLIILLLRRAKRKLERAKLLQSEKRQDISWIKPIKYIYSVNHFIFLVIFLVLLIISKNTLLKVGEVTKDEEILIPLVMLQTFFSGLVFGEIKGDIGKGFIYSIISMLAGLSVFLA